MYLYMNNVHVSNILNVSMKRRQLIVVVDVIRRGMRDTSRRGKTRRGNVCRFITVFITIVVFKDIVIVVKKVLLLNESRGRNSNRNRRSTVRAVLRRVLWDWKRVDEQSCSRRLLSRTCCRCDSQQGFLVLSVINRMGSKKNRTRRTGVRKCMSAVKFRCHPHYYLSLPAHKQNDND